MENGKLIELLKSFSVGELREFKDFVASPFFNKNEDLIRLYAYLKNLAPHFSGDALNRKQIYQLLFPEATFNDKKIRYLMSDLLLLIEQYIGFKYCKKQIINPSYYALNAYVDRGLDKHYQFLLKKTQDKLEKSPYRNTAYFLQEYLIAEVDEHFFLKKQVRKFDNRLQKVVDSLDLFYLSNKLKYSCEMLNFQKVLSAEYNIELGEEIKEYLATSERKEVPIIAIYYEIFLMLSTDKDIHYWELKKLLNKYVDITDIQERKLMYFYAINFCIRKVREKEERYVSECLELYLKGIDEEFIFEKGYLSPWTYKNVVKLGLRLKRFEWTEQFIIEHEEKLPENFRKNARYFNMADLYFYKEDFGKAQEYLTQVEFSDIYYNLDSKVMLLKIYYKLKEEEALSSLLASFSIFLKRNKLISTNVRKTYLNFCSLLQQLMRKKKTHFVSIHDKIINTEMLSSRQWLLDVYQERLEQQK